MADFPFPACLWSQKMHGVVGICVVDPVNNFIQDLDSHTIEAFLCLIQSNSVHTGQAVQAKIFVYLFDAILDIWNWSISKLLHQLL